MDLYQELILEHSKRPHGAGLRAPFAAEVHHVNPTCGDEVRLRVRLSADHTCVEDVSYDAQGCAISRASTSVLHDLVAGRPVADGLRAAAAMESMLTSRGTDPGDEEVLGDGVALTGLYMQEGPGRVEPDAAWRRARQPFAAVREQLEEYFAGGRTRFELRLALAGTEWQRRVWEALERVPYGETVSYGELAGRLGRPSAARAMGAANALNPISIVVPCHRVVGANGALTGYAGGVERKRFLLALEARAKG